MSQSGDLSGIKQLAYDGAIDADGHILEPPDLWEQYLEPKFRDRALRIVRDPEGLEELEVDGRRSAVTAKGMLIQRFGATQFLWASDYPHADHTPDYLSDLEVLAADRATT
jgi:hypothetical protein